MCSGSGELGACLCARWEGRGFDDKLQVQIMELLVGVSDDRAHPIGHDVPDHAPHVILRVQALRGPALAPHLSSHGPGDDGEGRSRGPNLN